MERILKTVFTLSNDEATDLIERVLSEDNEVIFSEQEKDCFSFIQNIIDTSGNVPSEDYFLDCKPEYTVALKKAVVLAKSDIKTHFALVIQKRKNQNSARILMKASSEVLEHGVTYDVADAISALKPKTQEDSVNHTLSAQGIADFYALSANKPAGLSSSLTAIDEAIGALPFGGVSVLLGYTGHGKSLLGNNIMYHNYIQKHWNIVILSFEIPKEDVLTNLLSRHSNNFNKEAISPWLIKFRKLTEEQKDFLFNTVAQDFFNRDNKLIILDETDFASLSFSEIRAKLEQVDDYIHEANGQGIDAIMVDHVGLLNFTRSATSNKSAGSIINDYVSFFRKLSLAFRRDVGSREWRKIHVMLLAQANREGKKRADKAEGLYDLQAISDANELERAAQVVMSIWVNEEYKLAKQGKVCLLKNRNGPVLADPIEVRYDPAVYLCGDEQNNFSTALSMDDFTSGFGDDINLDLM